MFIYDKGNKRNICDIICLYYGISFEEYHRDKINMFAQQKGWLFMQINQLKQKGMELNDY